MVRETSPREGHRVACLLPLSKCPLPVLTCGAQGPDSTSPQRAGALAVPVTPILPSQTPSVFTLCLFCFGEAFTSSIFSYSSAVLPYRLHFVLWLQGGGWACDTLQYLQRPCVFLSFQKELFIFLWKPYYFDKIIGLLAVIREKNTTQNQVISSISCF